MKTVVIGGGPSGMMAAITASSKGDKVILFEKENVLGRKLLMTGKQHPLERLLDSLLPAR